jgi:hypothetical protein
MAGARRNLSSKLDEEARRAASEGARDGETAALVLEPARHPQLDRARALSAQLKKELKGELHPHARTD